jgi:hypothetical protein
MPAVAGLLAAMAALTGCYPRPYDPVDIPLPPAPYVRAPYVQAVDTASARVLWMTDGAPDTLFYRRDAQEQAWRSVMAQPHGGSRLAVIAGLEPSTRVEYMVSAAGVRTDPYAFETAPSAAMADHGSGSHATRVLVFGDSGWGSQAQTSLASLMRRTSWHLAIHTGDLAYDNGSRSAFTQRHFRVYQRVLSTVPFFPVAGNHDLRADGGLSYDEAFYWEPPRAGVRYYSFRWGNALFVALDTSSPTDDVGLLRAGAGRQFEWLQETLRDGSTDPTVRWMIVYMHHSVYSHAIGISAHGPDADLRRNLVPLFERYGVDLVAAGHDHHYERLWPLRHGRPVEEGCGPVYILTGGGGASMYARDVRPSPLAARVTRRHHYVGLTIHDHRMAAEVIDSDGEVMDAFAVLPFAGEASSASGECGG